MKEINGQQLVYDCLINTEDLDLLKKLEKAVFQNKPYILMPSVLLGKINTKPQSKFAFYLWFRSILGYYIGGTKNTTMVECKPYRWEGIGFEFIYILSEDLSKPPKLNILIQIFDNKLKLDTFPF